MRKINGNVMGNAYCWNECSVEIVFFDVKLFDATFTRHFLLYININLNLKTFTRK